MLPGPGNRRGPLTGPDAVSGDWSHFMNVDGVYVGMSRAEAVAALGEPEVEGQVHGVTYLKYPIWIVRIGKDGVVQTMTGETLLQGHEVCARLGATLPEVLLRLGPPTKQAEAEGQAGIFYHSDTLTVLLEFATVNQHMTVQGVTLLEPSLGVIWSPDKSKTQSPPP